MPVYNTQLEELIHTFLERKNAQKSQIKSEEDLKKIALDTGLSESDWDAFIAEFRKLKEQGKSFFQHKNPEDAVIKLQKALEMNPFDLEANAIISEAYLQKFMLGKQNSDRENALKYARKCLDIDSSHQGSYELITALKQNKGKAMKSQKSIIIFSLVAAVSALILFFVLFPQDEKKTNNTAIAVSEETTVSESSSTDEARTVSEDAMNNSELGIPVSFEKSSKTKGMEFIADKSEISDYSNSYSYNLLGYLRLSGIELDVLKLKIDGINADGKTVFTGFANPAQDFRKPYYSGDLVPVQFMSYNKDSKAPPMKKVRITAQKVSKNKAPEKYEASKTIDYEWAYERPANYNFEIRERFKSVSTSFDKNKVYFELALEAENTGNTAVEVAQMEIEWYDKSGKKLESKTAYFTTSSSPKIKRGHTRVYSGTWSIPVSADKLGEYKVKIIRAE